MTVFLVIAVLLALCGLANMNRQLADIRRELAQIDPYGTKEPTE